MFGFGNNEKKTTPPPTPAPTQNRYARTSFKLDPEDELGTDYSRQKAIGSTFGTTDVDYALAHYAPMLMRQLDHIEIDVNFVYNAMNKLLKYQELECQYKNLEGRFADLDVRYGELYEKHNLLLKYLADEHLQKEFAYKDETQEQKVEENS